MEKYFKVTIKEDVSPAKAGLIVERTEFVCAKSLEEVIADFIRRLGEHLVSCIAKEIPAEKIHRSKRIYVVM